MAGLDLIAYVAAAKLKAAGAQSVRMIDTSGKPRAPLLAQWYFRRWVRPEWQREVSPPNPGRGWVRGQPM